MFADLRARLRALVRRSTVERELDAELQFHVEQQIEQFMNAGLDRDDAARRARLVFGGLDQIKEECRDARGTRLIEELWRDVQYAVRMMRRRTLSTATAIATVAVGIGLNAAVFSLVDWVLLRPLPYPSADELVKVQSLASGSGTGRASLTYAEFERASMSTNVAASVAFSTSTRVLSAPGIEPAHIVVARLSGDLFRTFGIAPVVGRSIAPAEIASRVSVAVISDELWRRRFSSDLNVLSRVVTLDGTPHTILGVMPPGRGYPGDVDLWRPTTAEEREDDDRDYVMVARLASGTTIARTNVESAARNLVVDSLQQSDAAHVRRALIGLLASVVIVLVIACANVATLLGARGADRFNELTIRRALGATHGRLLQQLVTETVLLVTLGGAAGLALGRSLSASWWRSHPSVFRGWRSSRLTAASLQRQSWSPSSSPLLSAVLGARFAALPGPRLTALVGPAGRSTAGTQGRRTVVAVQTALAVVLTVAAGLLARSVQQLLAVDHGLDAAHLMAVELTLRGGVSGDSQQFFRDVIDSAQSVPGVRSAAVALLLPTGVAGPRTQVRLGGDAPGAAATVTFRTVTARYFETAGIPITAGRDFNAQDSRGRPRVAIVNRAFVRDVLKGAAAVGARVTATLADEELSIVGEVADITPAGVADRPALYVSAEQTSLGGGVLLVRVSDTRRSILPQLKARLRSVAPALPLDRIHDVETLLAAGGAPARFSMTFAASFALLAVILAAIGVYGLTAGEVIARWRELAVRLALGATRLEALSTIVRPAATAVGAGVLSGISAAFMMARWMQSLLHGVGPTR